MSIPRRKLHSYRGRLPCIHTIRADEEASRSMPEPCEECDNVDNCHHWHDPIACGAVSDPREP